MLSIYFDIKYCSYDDLFEKVFRILVSVLHYFNNSDTFYTLSLTKSESGKLNLHRILL